MLKPIFTQALQLLASAAIRETLLILVAYGLIRLLKHSTAAFRHWTWNLALIGGLVIPLMTAISPVWSVPVLPAFQNNVPPAASSFKTDPRLLEQNPASENPQVKARRAIVEYDYPELGPIKAASNPIKLSDAPFAVRRLSPRVGEHTAEIMHEVGFSDAEIAALRDAKAIGMP